MADQQPGTASRTLASSKGDAARLSAGEGARPLAAIREKERALQQSIHEVQARADQRVAEARASADVIKDQAERDGLREAEAFYQEGLGRARAEAEAIQAKGAAEAAAAGAAGRAHILRAVEYIVHFVLPRGDT